MPYAACLGGGGGGGGGRDREIPWVFPCGINLIHTAFFMMSSVNSWFSTHEKCMHIILVPKHVSSV